MNKSNFWNYVVFRMNYVKFLSFKVKNLIVSGYNNEKNNIWEVVI